MSPGRTIKSSGSEHTYPEDLTDLTTIRGEIADMATDAASWLDRRQLLARTVTIKVRYADFTTVTRRHTTQPTRNGADLVARATALLERTHAGRRPVRLLGVSVQNLCGLDVVTEPADRLPFPVA